MKRSQLQERFRDADSLPRPDGVADEVWTAFLEHLQGKSIGQICREQNLGRTFVDIRFRVVAGRIAKWSWLKDDGELLTFARPPAVKPCKWCGREDWTPKPTGAVFCSKECRRADYDALLARGREDRRRQRLRDWLVDVYLSLPGIADEDIDSLISSSNARARLKMARDALLDRGHRPPVQSAT